VHTHGGYQVHIASMGRRCFGLKASDVWWATSDVGWIVGHSYMVYAPLLAGATTVVFEGALDHPSPIANWQRVVDGYGATGIFTSPTAVRLLRRYGEDALAPVSHATIERVVCAGEVLNPQALEWLQNTVLGGRVPVIDNMWQTETGGPVIGNPYWLSPAAHQAWRGGLPLARDLRRRRRAGRPSVRARREGDHGDHAPVPGAHADAVGRPARYGRDYWERIHGSYLLRRFAYPRRRRLTSGSAAAPTRLYQVGPRTAGDDRVESAFVTHLPWPSAAWWDQPDEVAWRG
jgi:acetyl-CoA synthetase